MQTTLLIDSTESALSRSDRAAVERATGLLSGSVVHVCCPSGNEAAIRYAVAAGAKALVSLEQISAGLVVCGLGGLGTDGELTAARLALRLQAQLVLDVLDFSQIEERLEVVRKLDRGETEFLIIALPAVLVMSDAAPTKNYLSRFRQVSVSLPEREIPRTMIQVIHWEAVRPRTRTADLTTKTVGGAQQRMFATFGIDNVSAGMGSSDDGEILSDPEECAVHLLRYLTHHGFIDSKKVADETTRSADQTKRRELLAPARNTQTEQSLTSARQTDEKFSFAINRHVPRPLQLTPDAYHAKRSRQPHSMNHPGFGKPLMDHLTRARYRRRPRSIHQFEPSNQRGPIPLRKSWEPVSSNR
jgi:electron transfer flavoprotein alpha/beta subunit